MRWPGQVVLGKGAATRVLRIRMDTDESDFGSSRRRWMRTHGQFVIGGDAGGGRPLSHSDKLHGASCSIAAPHLRTCPSLY